MKCEVSISGDCAWLTALLNGQRRKLRITVIGIGTGTELWRTHVAVTTLPRIARIFQQLSQNSSHSSTRISLTQAESIEELLSDLD